MMDQTFRVCNFDTQHTEKGVKVIWKEFLVTPDEHSAIIFAKALSLKSNFVYMVVSSPDYTEFLIGFKGGEEI